MPKRKINITYANDTEAIIEGTIGTDGRFTLPQTLRKNFKANTQVRITIEKI